MESILFGIIIYVLKLLFLSFFISSITRHLINTTCFAIPKGVIPKMENMTRWSAHHKHKASHNLPKLPPPNLPTSDTKINRDIAWCIAFVIMEMVGVA